MDSTLSCSTVTLSLCIHALVIKQYNLEVAKGGYAVAGSIIAGLAESMVYH